jgi:diguanylate cyclase (GGDEF)-like protein
MTVSHRAFFSKIKTKSTFLKKFETRIILIIISTAVITATVVFWIMMVHNKNGLLRILQERSKIIVAYTRPILTEESFYQFGKPEDIDDPLYQDIQDGLSVIREISSLKYLYTIKKDPQGTWIYLIDGQEQNTPDFCYPGAPVEEELLPHIERAVAGVQEPVHKIERTSYGLVYLGFWPVFDGNNAVIGAIGMEYAASRLHYLDRSAFMTSICLIGVFIILFSLSFSGLFKGISRPFQKKLAYIDILTGLHNRTAFELDKKSLESNLKNHLPLTMIMFDLNNLKRVNDTSGHDKGDAYIILAARLIKEHFSEFGACYRIGGDEFCVITTGAEAEKIEAVLEKKFAKALSSYKNSIMIEGKGCFAIAYGMADYSGETDGDLHELFVLADKRMYERKKKMKEA